MTRVALGVLALIIVRVPAAWAWGRHDLITRMALSSNGEQSNVKAEPIETAARDLLKSAIPNVIQWAERYHREYDRRFGWESPEQEPKAFGRKLGAREQLLWQLENNIDTPLDFSVTASDLEGAPRTPTFGAPGMPRAGRPEDVLIRFSEEPDAVLDANLNREPYLSRLRESMGMFYEGNRHTHTFRHYYVPSSWLPPLWQPQGIAPYRAALYARLAIEAFRAKHSYWGYRFLAWSLHYAQDVTQPWHTVFLPDLSFLSYSRQRMRREVAAYHYLTEAMADSWLARADRNVFSSSDETGLSGGDRAGPRAGPWYVAELVESAARLAHGQAAAIASAARSTFEPIVDHLNEELKPDAPAIVLGGVPFTSALLDFSGNGAGATAFLRPIWEPRFSLRVARDEFVNQLISSLSAAVVLSRQIVTYVLREGMRRAADDGA